ncbi:MAG: D-tyrosyl-tRNA(Tyr) deacylase [Candidatus Zixiibacteriota bacterium]|nr:MAG: D-tyrosyl-tRNA(Tyr) deacylase [candidate division Zixibacteria bacterium]
MKIVLQRVSEASVEVAGKAVGAIGKGLLLLIGADSDDTRENAKFLTDKCLGLRIFEDEDGKMNLSVKDINGQILAVSQFTLSADVSKGRRPSFSSAMEPEKAEYLFNFVVKELEKSNLIVKTGEFGAKMRVRLLNDGPVTFVLEG